MNQEQQSQTTEYIRDNIVKIVDRNGGQYELAGRDIVSICRCGLSQNKPFCDGSHKGHFEHDAIAFALPPKKTV